MSRTVHIVEPGGWGGIYQHAASLADALSAAGVPVVLHTAADAEEGVGGDVARHRCFWRFARVRPRALRRAAIVAAWLGRGVPSCALRFRRGDIVHIEGWFRPVLVVPLAAAARLRGCALSVSPHTTFSRRGRSGEERLVRALARRADVVFLFSERDRARAAGSWGVSAVPAPLLVPTTEPDPALVAAWHDRWHGRTVVLFAGQVRPDKGLDVAVRAATQWGPELLLAVVGEDVGALAAARDLAARLGVRIDVEEGYQPLPRLVAALSAADLVVCPYLVSSQSSILTMATALGRPSVASDIGGLTELASAVVPPGDPDALAAAVVQVLRADRSNREVRRPGDVARPYVEAFGLLRTA